MSVELWTERYRPSTLDEYVWRDPAMRAKAEEWLAEGALPHLLLAGLPGTGKTSLALLLLRLLDIPKGDILHINASRERKVEEIQDKIGNFVNTWALGPSGIKYVLLDEFDAVSPLAQRMLRADLETYADITRFICTANYANKIIPALQSRFHVMTFQTLARADFDMRVASVLVTEGVEFDLNTLDAYVKVTYPDLRKCLSLVQHNTVAGKLGAPLVTDAGTSDYLFEAIDHIKAGRFLQARKLIVAKAQVEEYPDLYRFLYRNLDLFGSTPEQQDDALLVVRKAVVDHALVFDPEILLSATLVQLARIGNPLG